MKTIRFDADTVALLDKSHDVLAECLAQLRRAANRAALDLLLANPDAQKVHVSVDKSRNAAGAFVVTCTARLDDPVPVFDGHVTVLTFTRPELDMMQRLEAFVLRAELERKEGIE